MSIDHVIQHMKGYDVPFHFESELRAANRLADGVRDGVIVAIGSYRGQFDCALALHAHVPVYCIDPRQGWTGEARDFGDADRVFWAENVASLGLTAKIRPIELPSLTVAKVWDKPIGLLWIDGDHTAVAADLEAWLPFVMDGGIVGLHDNNSPMIIAAVTARDDLVEFERADISTFYRKEALHERFTYDGLTLWVAKGPYNKDDKYVLGEVRSYDLGPDAPRTILDVGGHIGAFSCWQASLYPDADIVAVEPETSRFLTLAKNAADFPNVTALHNRVGYNPQPSALFVDWQNSGSHRIIPLEDVYPGQSIIPAPPALTVEDIMDERGWTTIDLLKLDCEGAEIDILFGTKDDTLRHVKRVVGEFHSGYDDYERTIATRLRALGFECQGNRDPLAHATFVAINQNWAEELDTDDIVDVEPLIEYGTIVESTPATPRRAKKKPVRRKSA